MKDKAMSNITTACVMGAFLGGLIFTGWNVYQESAQERRTDEFYREAARQECADKGFTANLTVVQAYIGAPAYQLIREKNKDTLVVTCERMVTEQL